MTPRELLTLLGLAAAWGGSYLFIRVAVPALGPLPLAAGRVGLAALLLWGGLRLGGRRERAAVRWNALRPLLPRLLVLGGLNAALPYALIAAAELRLSASLGAVLGATQALWGVVFGACWLGERLSARLVGGLALGVAGVAVLVGWTPESLDAPRLASVLAALAATASYALAGVYAKRRLSDAPAPTLALGQQLGAAAWLVPPAALAASHAEPTRPALLALGALAVVSTAVAYLAYFWLLRRVGPTRTNAVTFLIPPFGAAWGILFLGEPLTRGLGAGLALVLVAVWLVTGAHAPSRVAGAAAPDAAAPDALGTPSRPAA